MPASLAVSSIAAVLAEAAVFLAAISAFIEAFSLSLAVFSDFRAMSSYNPSRMLCMHTCIIIFFGGGGGDGRGYAGILVRCVWWSTVPLTARPTRQR